MRPLDRSGVAQLRLAANLSEMCVESFWDRFTAEEILALFRACWASGWDFLPDEWTEAQVQGALRGFPPEWNPDTELPRKLPLLVGVTAETERRCDGSYGLLWAAEGDEVVGLELYE